MTLTKEELNFENIKKELYGMLNSIIDDELVSEYLLINIISTVFIQRMGIREGQTFLNLFKYGDQVYKFEDSDKKFSFPEILTDFYRSILPFSKYIPLELNYLENSRFSPNKNYENNLFEYGIL